jgi:hypothetical protein
MNAAKAQSLADALGGQFIAAMPETRQPGLTLIRADGRFVAMEGDDTDWGCGYVFPSQVSYDRYHSEGFQGTIPDSAEWHRWGGGEQWAQSLAFLIGGETHRNGGNIWAVRHVRPDGRFVVVLEDGAAVYGTEEQGGVDSEEYDWIDFG